MGFVFASILYLDLACSQHPSVPEGTFIAEQGFLDVQVHKGWVQSEICVELVSNLMISEQCTQVDVREVNEQLWLDVPVNTGVGKATVAIQLTKDEAFIPIDSFGTIWEFTWQSTPVSDETRRNLVQEAQVKIQKDTLAWSKGAFSMVNQEGDIKGALVFSDDEVRVFVFDQFWYTPEVQYTSIVEDNGDWLLYFQSEPAFFDEVSILRVHPLQSLVTVPRTNVPTKQDIRYRLEPDPPSFDVLIKLAEEQMTDTNESERQWLQQEGDRLLRGLIREDACSTWKPTTLDVTRLVGYDYKMEWNGVCEFVVEPTVEQHTRRYSGRFRDSNLK